MACPCWRFCVDDCPFPKEGIFLCVDNMYILIKLYIYMHYKIYIILCYVMFCCVIFYHSILYYIKLY